MEKDFNDNLPTAYFANEFALNGKTDITSSLEWMIFLFGISQIDPMSDDKEIPTIYIPVTGLKKVLKNNSGDFYRQLRSVMVRMAKTVCIFENDIVIDGHPIPRILTMFSEAGIEKRDNGELFLKLEISSKTAPIVKGLSRNFFGIKPPVGISSAHAINFLIYAKAERDRKRKYDGKTTLIRFELEEFKSRLNVVGKYPRIDNLKKRVVDKIKSGVNKSGIIQIDKIEYTKTGRSVTGIIFHVSDAPSTQLGEEKNSEEDMASLKETSSLTFAQEKALKFLLNKGIYQGIAVRKIIPNMPSSECEGYEDYFCEEVYKIVIEKSKVKNKDGQAAILVDWFKKDIFQNDHFGRIIENVQLRKKNLNDEARSNREVAKRMTSKAFFAWLNEQIDKSDRANEKTIEFQEAMLKLAKNKSKI